MSKTEKKWFVVAYLTGITLSVLCFVILAQVVHARDTARYFALLFLCFTSAAGTYAMIRYSAKFFGKFPLAPPSGRD